MNARIPKKPGQPDKSDKHSDLYTDEDPKGTIHGLKFATPDDAKASVSKIKSSGRSHAHKIQAAIAMEQRAKVMGKAGAAAVYRSFINSMKDKTEEMREAWSQKYKKSIDCNNPKGFSQRAHCQGRKKKMKEHIEEAKKLTSLEKFRAAAAEREKKHAEIEKNRSKDGSGLTAAIDRLSKQVNKEEVKLDEISDKLAGDYLKKANTNLIKKVGMKPDLYNYLEPKRQKGATRALNRLMKPVKEETHSPEDRGGADSYYGRPYNNPHKVGSQEHKDYHKGYHGTEFGQKDYGSPRGRMREDAPTNTAGSGAIAGLGVGPQGEPGVNMKKKKKVIPFAIFARKMPN